MKLKYDLITTILERKDREFTGANIGATLDGIEGFELYFRRDLYDVLFYEDGRLFGLFRNRNRATKEIWYGEVIVSLEHESISRELHCYLNDGTCLTEDVKDIVDVTSAFGYVDIKPHYKKYESTAAIVIKKDEKDFILLPDGRRIPGRDFFKD